MDTVMRANLTAHRAGNAEERPVTPYGADSLSPFPVSDIRSGYHLVEAERSEGKAIETPSGRQPGQIGPDPALGRAKPLSSRYVFPVPWTLAGDQTCSPLPAL